MISNWERLKVTDGAQQRDKFNEAPQEAQQMLCHLRNHGHEHRLVEMIYYTKHTTATGKCYMKGATALER